MNENGDPRWLARLQAFATFSSIFVIAVGSAGLAGWAFGVPPLRTLLPGLVAIKANSAVCLVLIGVALWLRRTSGGQSTVPSAVAKVFGLVVAVVGGLSLAECVRGWDFGIDQLLLVEKVTDAAGWGRPGLMSPVTAAVFVLVGIALLCLDWRPRGVWPAQIASLAATMACLLGLLDFVLGTRAVHTRIALQTAVALLVVSIAVPCARPQWGMGRLLASTSMGGMLARRLLPLSVVIPVLIGWFRWYAEIKGLYSDWGGLAIMILSMVVLLVGVSGWTAYVIDRTDRERDTTVQRLRISEERFRLLVEGLRDYAIYMLDPEGRVASWNAGAEAITGYSAAEVMRRPCSMFYTEQDRAAYQLQQELHTAVATGRHEEQVQRMRKDGSVFWANIFVAPLYNPDGGLRGFAKIVRDITARKQAEQALEYQRQRFEAVLENLPAMICLLTPDYHVAFANRAFRKQFGESQGRKCFEYCFGRSQPCEFCETYQVLKTGAPHDWEVSTPEGRRIHAFDFPFADSNGSPLILEMDIDITDQRKAEEELRSASRYARSLIEASLDPLVTIRKDGKIMDVNHATEAATGISRESLVGSDFSVYFTQPEKARAGYEQVFATGTVHDYPLSLRHTSGQVMDVLYNATVYKNEAGEVEGVFAAARDITQRKKAELELRRTSLYARNLIEASLDPLVTISKEGKIMDVNQATEAATGIRRDRLIGSDFSVYFTQPEKARAGYEQVFATGTVRDYPLALRHTSGHVMDVLYNATVYKNEAGEVEGVFAAARDVTQRKQVETALQYSEQRYRSLVVATSQVVWTTNAHGEVASDMPMWREFTGQTAEQIQGWGWIECLHPDDRDRTAAAWTVAVKNRTLYDTDYRMRRRDGEYRDVAVRGVPVFEPDGSIREWIGTCTDVTERRLAEEQLRLSQQRLALAQKAGKSGSFDWDIQNNLNVWSPEVEELYGLKPGEFGGKFESWEQLVYPDDLPRARQAIEESLKTGEFAGEWRIRRPDNGEMRWIDARAKVLFDPSGRPNRMVGINIDITDRKRAEEEIRELNDELEQRVVQRTAQLEASNKELEAFTYSVSHDLRAPLRHVAGFAKMLVEEYQATLDENAKHYLVRISEGVQRMGQLVDDLLNLARVGRKELGLQVTGLSSIVQAVIAELQPETEGRQVEWKIANLPFVECDPALMKQVFQNLLSNALKFTRPRPQAVIEVAERVQDGHNVIVVRDNGVGFSMKYADKLFGVFQRLHRAEDFEGTGVGLATVQRIIAKHGGKIWAEAELDKGATFYFTLGTSEAKAEKTNTAVAGAQS